MRGRRKTIQRPATCARARSGRLSAIGVDGETTRGRRQSAIEDVLWKGEAADLPLQVDLESTTIRCLLSPSP
jgi:hypothetical protein